MSVAFCSGNLIGRIESLLESSQFIDLMELNHIPAAENYLELLKHDLDIGHLFEDVLLISMEQGKGELTELLYGL